MSRLGIIIGVNENQAPIESLAACGNDARSIAAVLRETNRFDDTMVLIGRSETSSQNVKKRLSEFVEKHKSEPVEEILFYFSGHGDFSDDEFRHILSDFEPARPNRTTLTNSELDGLIRGLNPTLFVKIVDACHSGTSYIKSNEGLDNYLKSAMNGFKEVYFLYSSQSEEVSWASGSLSAFTKSILSAIAGQDSGSIRYRDLMSAASDYFREVGGQRPLFVTQADFTQVFCAASPSMQAIANKFFPEATPQPASTLLSSGKNTSLLERIKQTEDRTCTKEEALAKLEDIKRQLTDASLSSDFGAIFVWELTASTDELEDAVAVGNWLEKNTNLQFFARATFRTETYKKRAPYSLAQSASVFGMSVARLMATADPMLYADQMVDAERIVISGYSNTSASPFSTLTLRLTPKFRSVNLLECYVAPLLSNTDLLIFWANRQFTQTNWDSIQPERGALKWSHAISPLRDLNGISDICNRIKSGFIEFAEVTLASRWPEPSQTKTIEVLPPAS